VKRIVGLCLLLGGCATAPLQPPPQPTPLYLQNVNMQLATLVHSDGTPLSGIETWRIGVYAVRSACHVYLNASASQQKDLSLLGMGTGALGAGLSIMNPLAGLASSLTQTLLTAYSTSGPAPTTADAILIENSMAALETYVNMLPPASREDVVTLVDDYWFLCSPGGVAITKLKAMTSAQIGVSVNGQLVSPQATGYRGRPVIVVNPPPIEPSVETPLPPRRPRVQRRDNMSWWRATTRYIEVLDRGNPKPPPKDF